MKNSLISLAVLTLSQSLFAQQLPNAGSQLQQVPAAPAPVRPAPEIRLERGTAPVVPSGTAEAKVRVDALRITGSTLYSEADLIAASGFVPGREISLTELRSLAANVTAFYTSKGYFAAQALLPAQSIQNNTVNMTVSEGRYGKIEVRNKTKLSNALVMSTLSGVQSGDIITSAPLESRLLLLSDLPGVQVKSTLVPGTTPGTSDLIVDIEPGQRISGSVDVDNAGNRYTGEYRLGGTINLNNPLGLGDVLSFRGVTSGKGLNYGRAAYQMRFGKATAGVAYSRLNYELGKEFAILGATGKAEVASVFGSYPLIRSRNSNLSAGLSYDHKRFEDRIDIVPSVTNKKAQVVTASLYGNSRDALGGGGLNLYSAALSTGKLDIQTPAARADDAATARTNGSFNKLAFTVSRHQYLTDSLTLVGALSGQAASKNLDASERMELGGMNGVRAYPQGEATGDQGYLLNVEARYLVPQWTGRMPGQLNLIGFVDVGSVTINKNPWVAGKNSRTLSAAGVGATWGEANNYLVRAYYARKLGNEDATSAPDKSGRFWLQAIKYF